MFIHTCIIQKRLLSVYYEDDTVFKQKLTLKCENIYRINLIINNIIKQGTLLSITNPENLQMKEKNQVKTPQFSKIFHSLQLILTKH